MSTTTTPKPGMNSTVSHIMTHNLTTSDQSPSNNSLLLYLILISLSSVFVLLIMISILAFYMYKKRQGQKNKEAHDQDEDVLYANVVTRATKRKQKKKEDDVQYVELVFYTPARDKHKVAKVQDDYVYTHVQYSQ